MQRVFIEVDVIPGCIGQCGDFTSHTVGFGPTASKILNIDWYSKFMSGVLIDACVKCVILLTGK